MPEIVPSVEQMTMLVGKPLYEIWTQLCALIDEKYDMERLWGSGGKAWTYEYKYRRGGKTLCALAGRHGPMSINTAGAAKPCARFMPEKTASGLWSS